MPSSPTDNAGPPAAEPGYGSIVGAAQRLDGVAVVTPLLESPALNELCGGRVLVKAEMLQRTGSFKFRGAYNRLSQLDATERAPGVVAYSSGNHGQGVALAARLLGLAATIFMPASAPAIKQDATRRHGADVILDDGGRAALEAAAERLAEERGATLVRPFDDPEIIAGQGTVGREIAAQAKALGVVPEVVLVPCSGGGLAAGTAAALARELPGTGVVAVEPEGYDDTRRSLAAGERLSNPPGARSMCDALLVPIPGALTFPINARLLAGAVAVAEGDTAAAMVALFLHLKLVAEPSGAIALAACLDPAEHHGVRVVVASGGNVDAALFTEVLGREGP